MKKNTSWQKVSSWYDDQVGESGHYYHQKVILPNLKRIIAPAKETKILDLGCGQGVLARTIASECAYWGVDIAGGLLKRAMTSDSQNRHKYVIADITRKLLLPEHEFDWATMVLVMQNLKKPFQAISNARSYLKTGGKLVIVLNHPAFRIPKHSDWEVSADRTVQKRVVDIYQNPCEIPIESSPFDKKNNQTTWSYHWPISQICQMITSNGFMISSIEEWVSDKKSTGKMAQVEDKARAEFPLFMTIVSVACQK